MGKMNPKDEKISKQRVEKNHTVKNNKMAVGIERY
jgi:hypothetical protein